MAKQAKKVTNASVRLLADHLINGVIRKKGTVLQGYSGPLSANMQEIKPPRREPEEGAAQGHEGGETQE